MLRSQHMDRESKALPVPLNEVEPKGKRSEECSLQMKLLAGIFLLMIVSIYFQSGTVRHTIESEAAVLRRYGMVGWDCKNEIPPRDPSVARKERERSLNGDEGTLVTNSRLFFPLLRYTPPSPVSVDAPSTAVVANTDKIRCFMDCRHFQPDAGRCLQGKRVSHSYSEGNQNLRQNHPHDTGHYAYDGTHCLPSFLIIGAMKAGTG